MARRLVWLGVLLAAGAFGACSLNPQPIPPGADNGGEPTLATGDASAPREGSAGNASEANAGTGGNSDAGAAPTIPPADAGTLIDGTVDNFSDAAADGGADAPNDAPDGG